MDGIMLSCAHIVGRIQKTGACVGQKSFRGERCSHCV